MADQVTTRRLDDIHLKNGQEVDADRRYEIAIDGTLYRLDLAADHAAEWEKHLGPFLEAATPIQREETKPTTASRTPRRRPISGGTSTRRTSKETTAVIRAWAEGEEGIVLKPKGPLPFEVKQRYADAHGVDVATLT